MTLAVEPAKCDLDYRARCRARNPGDALLSSDETGDRDDPGAYIEQLRSEWDRHAETYDLVYGASEQRRLEEEIAFLEFAFESVARRPIEKILDLTAGTGAQSVELARRGYRVTAADISASMLARCEQRASKAGVALDGLLRREASETSEIDQFDVVISCFFGLCHLLRTDDLARVVAAAHRALKPGGLLVFDMINLLEDALGATPHSERSGVRDGVRFRSVMESRYDSWSPLVTFSEQTEVVDTRGSRTGTRVEFSYRGYNRAEILAVLASNGWDEVRAFRGYGDFGESTDDRVFRMVFACRK
jgi:2-polyprenyl-3-methyl-5-hydroxy-6-metoxy-1,4-benzoquinol methylase